MQTQEEKLQQEILGDAKRRAERTLQRAKREADKASKAVESRIGDIRTERLADAERMATGRENAISAGIDHELMRRWLEVREAAFEQLFTECIEAVENGQGDERADSLRELAIEAVQALGRAELVLRVRPEDAHVFDDAAMEQLLAQAGPDWATGASMSVEVDDAMSVGVVVETADGRKRFDNTYATRLQRSKQSLRAEVCHQAGIDLAGLGPERQRGGLA